MAGARPTAGRMVVPSACVAIWRPVALVLFVLLGQACASLPAPKQPFTDPARALSFQSLERERVRSIRAEARIDQRGREGRIKGTVLMFAERPGRRSPTATCAASAT
jgi:hypothetical protein